MLSALPILHQQTQISKITEDLNFCKKQIIDLNEEFTLFRKTTEHSLDLIYQLLSKSSKPPKKTHKKNIQPTQQLMENQWNDDDSDDSDTYDGERRRQKDRRRRRLKIIQRRNKQRSVSDTAAILKTSNSNEDDDSSIIRIRSYSISEGIIPDSKNIICLICGSDMVFCEKCSGYFCKNHPHLCHKEKMSELNK